MVGGTDAQNLLPPALAGYGRSVACGKGERIFAKHRGEVPWLLVQEGLVYLCAENERFAGASWRFFARETGWTRPCSCLCAMVCVTLQQSMQGG